MHRRQFLSTAAALAAAASFPTIGKARSTSRLRLGVIGTGMRGQVLLKELVRRDDVEVAALCDIEKFMLDRALKEVAEAGKPAPRLFTGRDQAWRGTPAKARLDGVIIARSEEHTSELQYLMRISY